MKKKHSRRRGSRNPITLPAFLCILLAVLLLEHVIFRDSEREKQ